MPTSTRSEATDRSPQSSDHNALALRTRGGTAKITRTREVIDRVVVEHLGSPPVTTTAEQQVIKTTRMKRGKRNSGQALEPPGHQDSGSKRRQTSSVNNGSGNGAPSVTAPVEVPIENAAPNVQEEDEGVEGEGAPLMSTQDYMAEAEELLANPMDTQEEAAPQGAPQAGNFDAAVTSLNEEAVAAQETGSAADAPEEAAEELDAAAVPMVIVATEEVVEEEPVVEEPEEATREAPALEEPAPAVSEAPAASSGGGGIFGSVAQVLHRVLHPSAGHARNGSGATEAEEAPVGMLAESAEAEAPSAPQEQAASEEPAQEVQEEQATPSKRLGRPPANSKKSKGVAPVPDAEDLPTSADPAVAALNPDAAGEPPEPEAVAEALQKVSASERKGKGSAKKSGRKGRQEPPAEEEAEAEQAEQDVDSAEEEAAAPAKGKSSSRATKKKKPAKATAAAVEEEAQDNDSETTPVPVFPPETHLDVQAPRTPAKRSQHPSKPASKPATQRLKGRAQEYTVEEPEEEEEEIEEEQQVRVSPRAKPTAAAAAEKEPSCASHSGHAVPEAPKTQAAAPSKAAATKPAAAKAAPAKKTPAKAAPTKAEPTNATKATPAAKPEPVKAAPAKAAPARGRQAQGGKQLPKKASGVAPKPRKMRRNENYKSYILRVLKEIHPGESISKNAMDIMDAFAADMFNRITLEAARLCRQTNKQTMTSREVETAVRLLLPGELGKHALSEGRKAVVSGLR